jgi:1-acyl-sn-glycerol-3-phosphate acyltransferase
VAFTLWAGVILAMLVPPLWIVVMFARSARAVDALTRWWCRTVLRLTGCRPIARGREHQPRRSAILVANHSSYLDVVALLAALPRDLTFVAKRELLTAPIVGRILRKSGHLTVDRVDLSRGVLDAARVSTAVRDGALLCVFPEGTFIDRPGLLPFRLGAFKAAVEGGCPIVPVVIRGTRDVLAADSWIPRPGRIDVTVLPPLTPAADGWREIVRLRDSARTAVASILDEG